MHEERQAARQVRVRGRLLPKFDKLTHSDDSREPGGDDAVEGAFGQIAQRAMRRYLLTKPTTCQRLSSYLSETVALPWPLSQSTS